MEFRVTARVIRFTIEHSSFFVPRNANATLCTPHFEFDYFNEASSGAKMLFTHPVQRGSDQVAIWLE